MNFLFTIVYLRWSHENGPLENDEGRKSNCVVWLATNGVEHRPGRRVSSSSLSYFPVCMTFCSFCYVLITRNHILNNGQLHFQFFFVLLKFRKLILRQYKFSLNPFPSSLFIGVKLGRHFSLFQSHIKKLQIDVGVNAWKCNISMRCLSIIRLEIDATCIIYR